MASSQVIVSVVIPNWNGKHLLEVCLPSLKTQIFQHFEVIIVDNGSSDGSVDYIKKNFPKFSIIDLKENTGFSPAVNLGIKKAKGKYIFLLNNDTKVDKNCIKYLVETLNKKHDVGMVAAKMLNFYTPELIDSAGDYIDVVGHANNIGLGEKDGPKYNKEDYVFLVTGGGSLIRKKVFEQVGLLDDSYFAYFEDVDFCLRAQFQGFKGYYQPKAVVYHIHMATSSKNPAFKEYLQFRNMTTTILKDFPTALLKSNWNWLRILLVNLNTIRYLFSIGYGKEAVRAEWYVLSHLGSILSERRKVQNSIVVSTDYLISQFRTKEFNNIILKKLFG
jgi:GT2 family glycosyltransferase